MLQTATKQRDDSVKSGYRITFEQTKMNKMFYENDQCSVSENLFVTPTGDIFLIRNISSVKIRESDGLWLLAIGGLLLAFAFDVPYGYMQGIERLDTETVLRFLGCLFLGMLLCAAWWFSGRKFVLYVVLDGKRQEALSVPRANKDGEKIIKKIQHALGLSMANLQNK